MIYVLSNTGTPLMPTGRSGKVRRMLRDGLAVVVSGLAVVVRCEPFTIQLLYDTTGFIQPVTLGVDTETKHVGLSATTETRELFTAEVSLRSDIVKLLSTRREARRTRHNRKTRYREARFDNRRHAAFAPSIEQRIQSHLQLIGKVNFILPITKTVIEVRSSTHSCSKHVIYTNISNSLTSSFL